MPEDSITKDHLICRVTYHPLSTLLQLSSDFFRLLQPIFSQSSRLPPVHTVSLWVSATRGLTGKQILPLGGIVPHPHPGDKSRTLVQASSTAWTRQEGTICLPSWLPAMW